VLLIHGSAADHTTWSIQLASPLALSFSLIAYDRRVEARSVEATPTTRSPSSATIRPPCW